MTRLVVQCLHSVESNLRHQDCLTIQSQRPCQDVTRSEKLSGQSVRVVLFYIPFRNIGKCATRDLREVEITCDMTKYEFCWVQFSSINRNISVELDICISLRDFRFIDQDFHLSVAREIPLLKYMVSFTKNRDKYDLSITMMSRRELLQKDQTYKFRTYHFSFVWDRLRQSPWRHDT